MDCDPSTSVIPGCSSKRKRPDSEDHDGGIRPLRQNVIENEYEISDAEASDEEEIDQPLARGDMDQIERAQEASTVSDISGIKITPFNLEEELEEGEFDKAGNFIFKRRQNSGSDDEETDTWAETVDWDEVKRREEAAQQVTTKSNDHRIEIKNHVTHEVDERPSDKMRCYKEMLRLMHPKEVVKRAIQRLGDAIPKRKPVNKNKRIQEAATLDQASVEQMRRNLDLMIELAHQMLEDGDVDIYQKSYEELKEAINA